MAARKSGLKAVGLFDKAPLEVVPPAAEAEAPKPRKRAASTRDETLYSFTFRLRLEQRTALDEEARARVKPTAPGKADASEVLREVLDEWMAGRT
jgi:hypothetical protein